MQYMQFKKYYFWIMVIFLSMNSLLDGQERRIQTFPYGATKTDENTIVDVDGVRFNKLIFEGVDHLSSQFKDTAYFYSAEFRTTAYFNFSVFEEEAIFGTAVFNFGAEFAHVVFKKDTDFFSTFHDNKPPFKISIMHKTESTFVNSKFHGNVNFSGSVFNIPITFWDTIFDGVLQFRNAEINSNIDFTNTKFGSIVSFYNCICHPQLKFPKSQLPDTLIFSNGNYKSGIDLRDAKYNKLSKIYLDNSSYPDGEFLVYWDQIKMRDGNFIIGYMGENNDQPNVAIQKLERIYVKLKNNYIKLGDEKAAYDVMYEFEQQKERLSGDLFRKISDITFGYGYRPTRFLIVVLLIILLLFSPIYYFLFYDYIIIILDNKLLTEQKSVLKKLKSQKANDHWKNYFFDHTILCDKIALSYRIWHSILFSASVLVSLRFKRDWVNFVSIRKKKDTLFIWFVSFEYFVGLFLYYIFFSNLKISQFENITKLINY